MVEDAAPRLLADAMLGKLARWLRILGYDTQYLQGDDATIAHRARAEGRILLTRDHELARRRGLQVVLIASQSWPEQLREVVAAVGVPDEERSRCMVCNGVLDPLPREAAKSQVPPYVAKTQSSFHRCAECGRIYWQGTHWDGIRRRLEKILDGRTD